MVRLNSTVYQILIASFAAFGSFLFGYDLGVIAEVVAGAAPAAGAARWAGSPATTKTGTKAIQHTKQRVKSTT